MPSKSKARPKTPTRAQCQKEARAAVEKWRKVLGLDHWEIAFDYGDAAEDEKLDGSAAYVHVRNLLRIANVVFDERVKRERYDFVAAHEVLHVLLEKFEAAIQHLTEPAKSLLEAEHHASLDRIAQALTGQQRPYRSGFTGDLAKQAPWSAE